jgi:hypothetical protein
VNVPVNIDEGAGVAKFKFVIAYDDTILEDTDVVRGSLLSENWLVLRRSLGSGAKTPGTARVEITGQSMAGELLGPGGSLAIVKFKVKDDAAEGTHPLAFSESSEPETTYLKDSGDNVIDANYTDGQIDISALAKGDVNADGFVNIVDALLVARYDAGLSVSNFHPEVGDVDGSGLVDIIDALHIARYDAGLPDPYLP